jgi:Domain of unknown function (DUF4386)
MTSPTSIQTATDAFTPNTQRSNLNGNRLTGALLVIVPLVFTLIFTLLGTSFEYPDILRKPVPYVLERFAAGGPGLVAMWYGMFASALVFTAIPILTRKVFPEHGIGLDLGVTFGVLAGLVQALGFARWVFLVPALAATNADPSSSEATRAAVGVVFDAFNRYAGIAVGEHLGYLFTALWTLSISIPLLQRSRLLAITGAVFALGILAGLLEPFGFGWAGAVNAIAYIAWSVWMVAFGLVTWRAPKSAAFSR